MNVLAIAWTNLRRTLRERISLFFVFVFPLLLILVLGLAFGGSSQPRVGLTVPDPGPLAAQLHEKVAGVEGITLRAVRDEADLVSMVERGRLEAGLVITADYDLALAAGNVATVRFIADRPGHGDAPAAGAGRGQGGPAGDAGLAGSFGIAWLLISRVPGVARIL